MTKVVSIWSKRRRRVTTPLTPLGSERTVEVVMEFLYYFENETYNRLNNPKSRRKMAEWIHESVNTGPTPPSS